jgi:hypothetical protein
MLIRVTTNSTGVFVENAVYAETETSLRQGKREKASKTGLVE